MNLLEKILDIIFPKYCIGCNKPYVLLCDKCFKNIKTINKPVEFKGDLDKIFIACDYNNIEISNLIKLYKYKNIKELEKIFKKILKIYFNQVNSELFKSKESIIINVPIYRKRYIERGFDNTFALAEICAEVLNIPFESNILKRIKYNSPQMGLNLEEREGNVKNNFIINKTASLKETVFIVDDVYTTGSTLNECAKVLKSNGVKHVYGIVLAKKLEY